MSFSFGISESREGGSPIEHFNAMARLVGWADRVGPLMREALQKEAPVRSGRLRDSIRYRRRTSGDGLAVEWSANTPYADFVVHGTQAHTVHPVATHALHITDAHGDAAFAMFANIPEIPANDFPGRAATAHKTEIVETLREAMKKERP